MILRTSVVCIHNHKMLGFYAEDPVSKERLFFPPGGKVENGESLIECARRETLEETGYSVLPLPETELIVREDFPWAGKKAMKESHYFLAIMQPNARTEVSDASYHRGYVWLDLDDVKTAFSYSQVIQDAVTAQIQKYRAMNLDRPKFERGENAQTL